MKISGKNTRFFVRGLTLLCLLCIGVVSFGMPVQSLRAATNEPADIEVYLWPDDTTVDSGDLVRVEVQVKNEGKGDATGVQVRLPKHNRQYIYTDTRFEDTSEDDVTLSFGDIPAGDEAIENVYLRVQYDPPFRMLYLYATYSWNDAEGGEDDVRSPRVAITVVDIEDDLSNYEGSQVSTGQPRSHTPPQIGKIVLETFGNDGYELSWEATAPNGIDYYIVDYQELSKPTWNNFRDQLKEARAVFAPAGGKHYVFRVRAVDWAGNESAWKKSPRTTSLP